MQDAAIELVPHSAHWPQLFQAEKVALSPLLAPWLCGDIEHIGSTAVPGLLAKPVIDLMAPVVSLEASLPAIDVLTRSGYAHADYQSHAMHWFCKPSPALRTHHLHLVPMDSGLWRERIAFREALRQSPTLAEEYGELKKRLAAQFRHDREGYTAGKTQFVQRLLRNK